MRNLVISRLVNPMATVGGSSFRAIFAVMFFLPLVSLVSYANEIVVSPSGSDLNNGSALSPVKTIAHGISLAKKGGLIRLRAGTYREAVSIFTPNISLQAYPGDSTPILSGADVISDWRKESKGFYSAAVNTPIAQVYVDQKVLPNARFPKVGYLKIENVSIERHAIGNAVLSTLPGSACGAIAQVRTTNWSLESLPITFCTGNEVGSTLKSIHEPSVGFGFYLENKLWMLDAPGAWVYDSSAQRLFVWLPDGSDPKEHLIEAAVRNGVRLGADHDGVSGIEVVHTSGYALSVDWGKHSFLIEQNFLHDLGGKGILANGAKDGTIAKNKIERSVTDAISIQNSKNISVLTNDISESGTIGSPRGSEAAISASESVNALIQNNRILDTGYDGITFSVGSHVLHNLITHPCLVLQDCAGIYTVQYSEKSGLMNAEVSDNTISETWGNYEGTPYASGYPAAGIYLDERTAGVKVLRNLIFNNERGLYLNNSNRNQISKNTFYANRATQLHLDEFKFPDSVYDNEISENTFIPTRSVPPVVLTGNFKNINFGQFNGNQYITLYSDQIRKERFVPGYPVQLTPETRYFNLSQIQAEKQMEKSGQVISPVRYQDFMPNSTSVNLLNEFSADPFNVWSEDSTATLKSELGIQSVVSGLRSTIVSSPSFSLQKGITYRIRFQTRITSGSAHTFQTVVREGVSPYTPYAHDARMPLQERWTSQQLIFTADTSTDQARLDLELAPGIAMQFRNPMVQAVEGIYESAVQDTHLIINSSLTNRSYDCPDDSSPRCSEYTNLNGEKIIFPLLLKPDQSQLLIWKSSPFAQSAF